jgi:hypothetical protein
MPKLLSCALKAILICLLLVLPKLSVADFSIEPIAPVEFGPASGISGSNIITDVAVCIISTPGFQFGTIYIETGIFAVSATSPAGQYQLVKDGITIDYQVYFDRGSASSNNQLTNGVLSQQYQETAPVCEEFYLRFEVNIEELKTAPAGDYTDTLVFAAEQYGYFFGGEFVREEFSVNISFTIPKQVKISGLEDLTLTGDDTLLSAEDPDGFCVFATWGSLYSITATSLEGSFELRDGTTIPTLPYDVLIKDSASSTWSSALVYGVQAPGDRFGDDDQSCSTGNNMDLRIEANPAGVNAGTYTGTLYLTVRPI